MGEILVTGLKSGFGYPGCKRRRGSWGKSDPRGGSSRVLGCHPGSWPGSGLGEEALNCKIDLRILNIWSGSPEGACSGNMLISSHFGSQCPRSRNLALLVSPSTPSTTRIGFVKMRFVTVHPSVRPESHKGTVPKLICCRSLCYLWAKLC